MDKLLQRWTSRKLLVWTISTMLLVNGFVDSEQWMAIALAYLGSQGLADIAVKWKSANGE